MIIRPLLSKASTGGEEAAKVPEQAWTIVSRMQNQEADQYLLISQPDHARLSGEMAALFHAPFLPPIDDNIAKAIAAHDDGWGRIRFERDLQGEPPRTSTGRPQHFMQVTVEESLAAWTGSIKAVGEISPLGEYMVSGHFSRIGRMRIQMEVDTPEDLTRLHGFVQDEDAEQEKLQAKIALPKERLAEYVDLLQLCDVLSLYLCCGATETADFPQQFGGNHIRIRYDDGVYSTEPSLFGATQRFYLPVRIYPSHSGEGHTRIGFHIK
jgi:hypothetical protein